MKSNKRILIFNVNWLGDVLFSTATIRNIRRNFPDAFIACVIPSRCYSILKDNPHLDEVIVFDERDRHKGMLGKLSFVQSLKSKRFDLVFLLHRSFTRALICRLADISERVGYSTKKRSFLLTKKITSPKRDSLHRIDYYLNIIEKAGLRVEDRYAELYVSEKDKEFIDKFLNDKTVDKNDFLVGINPGGNWLPKRWLTHYWARLSDRLITELGYKVIITGSTSDIALVREIENLMLKKPIVATALLNINQLAALCKRLDLFITADTGPLHIANAVGLKRIIALFGPTSPHITGPYPSNNVVILSKDVGCKIPCYIKFCKDNRCMKAITPDEVIEKVKLLTVNKDR
jgi:lipopolysaccharide heptosyltransferase II